MTRHHEVGERAARGFGIRKFRQGRFASSITGPQPQALPVGFYEESNLKTGEHLHFRIDSFIRHLEG
jgi:hypothetical protein